MKDFSKIKICSDRIVFEGKDYFSFLDPRVEHSRRIFFLDEYVVKVDGGNEGFAGCQCEDEFLRWEKYKDSDVGKHLVPVLFFGHSDLGDFLVQPKKNIDYSKNKDERYWDQLEKVADEINVWDVDFDNDPKTTNTLRNWFVENETVLIFDYGC